jgi:hypothetical protein
MTPEILGSSGHMQLGGDLISLKTFLGLKALLAEQILACCGEIVEDRWPPGEAGWWGAIHLAGLALDARAARRWQA